MLGNDVIDLRDPETWPGACHPRFDHRVFTPAERAAIATSPRPALARWVHWAAKESAYKAARRRLPTTVFSPRRFRGRGAAGVAAGPPNISGTIRHGAERYRLRIHVADDLVHVIAWEEGATGTLVSEVARLDADTTPAALSAGARALAVRTVAGLLGVPATRLAVVRAAGSPPMLLCDGAPERAVLSLSHHGRLVAFACLLGEPGPAR
jgi:phosphopantetheinyl transferase (holo-ACP synthase)